MTRQETLYSMTGATLIQEADKLGVKVACNKTRTQLKESKQSVIDRILAFEASQVGEIEKDVTVEHKLVPMPGIEKLEELKKEYSNGENIFDFVTSILTVDYKISNNGKKITLLCNNKSFATIYKRKNSIRLYCAKEVIENLGSLVYNIGKGEKLNQLSAYVEFNNIKSVISKIS